MTIGTIIQVNDPLTNATATSLFTFAPTAWGPLTTGTVIDIGPNGVYVDTSNTAAAYSGGAVRLDHTFPNNQYSQAVVSSLTGGPFGVSVRASTASGGSAYQLFATSTNFTIGKLVNGTWTLFISLNVTYAAGDTLLLQAVGTVVKAFHNGTLIYWTYDNAITSGAPGLASSTGTTSSVFKTWQGGDATDAILTPGLTPPRGGGTMAGVTGGFTANTWKTLSVTTDVNGALGPPPTGTTGVLINWQSTATGLNINTRPTGSTFNTMPPAGTATTATNKQGWFIAPLAISAGVGQFDAALNTTGAGLNFYVLGYFGPETVFLNPPVVISPTGTMTPATPLQFQWTTYIPTIPAGTVAVICDLWGIQPILLPSLAGAGEITKWQAAAGVGVCQSVIVGYGSGWAYFAADNSSTAPTIVVRGYLKSGITWENTANDISSTFAAANTLYYMPVSSAATSANATGMIYQWHGAGSVELINQWAPSYGANMAPQNGQTMLWQSYPPRAQVTALPVTVGEQAYIVGAPLPTGPVTPTAPKGYVSVRSTSQS